MARGFAITFFSIFGYILAWGLVIAPIAILSEGEEIVIAILVPATLVLFTAGLLPFMNFVSKRAFHFEGQGKPVSYPELEQTLLEINEWDAPVMVQQQPDRLVFTWNYVAARWWEIIAKAGLKKCYHLHARFDADKNEVLLIDIMKNVQWRVGPGQVKLSGGFFRGINMTGEFGKAWGIKENFQLGKIYDYKFTSAEIRNPVMNTILRLGWSVRLGMW